MPKRTNGRLTDVHRAFLVREMACFASPTEAATAIKETFDIVITPQAAQHYDPLHNGGSKPSKKWSELFALARQAFLDEVSNSIPLAHKAVRVRKLAKAARAYEDSKNYMAMARILEQIAKEVGNVHTNRHEFTGKGGGPIRYQAVGDMTDEQIYAELRSYGIDPDLVHTAPKSEQ